jgi:hypothetical protein
VKPRAADRLKPGPLRRTPHEERQRQVRGLILFAMAAIVFSILRAGVHRVFTPGWWRLW